MLVEELNHRFTAIGYACARLCSSKMVVCDGFQKTGKESARAEQQPLPNMRSTLRPFFLAQRQGNPSRRTRRAGTKTKLTNQDTQRGHKSAPMRDLKPRTVRTKKNLWRWQ
jgi:hypothetical protein